MSTLAAVTTNASPGNPRGNPPGNLTGTQLGSQLGSQRGDLRAVCTTRLPATTADRLLVPTSAGPRDYANLDHAASTPALVAVAEAVERTLRTYASVHRGNGYASRVTSAWYEQAREQVARFVGARPALDGPDGPDGQVGDVVIFTRTTTDSWNLLARALPADTTVVVFASEHHSTLLPWGARSTGATVTLPVPRTVADGLDWLDSALATVTSEHTLVVVAGASNVTGEVWPVEAITRLAHRYGARVALDAAQLAPHRRIDLAASGVDYVAFSGHKLYAPYGAGVLAGRADWLDAAQPYLVGGGATSRVDQCGVTWATGAARHEGGSPNVVGAVALAAACAVLEEHREDLARFEHLLAERLRRGLDSIPGVHTHSLFGPGSDRVGVVAFTIDGLDSSLVSTALSVEHGIGVRDGKFCAHPLVDALLADGDEGTPTTAVRASIGLASRPEHVERLVAAVAGLAASGPGLAYTRGTQGWEPRDDPRDVALPRPW
ncbi:MAG: aminotransferase class V-fold PLP-dependent enzyme [Actinomycetales bacterium]|nr:aminotransferase class V-fold PLP-dependent enzyme [Actinomycetales bacterium]